MTKNRTPTPVYLDPGMHPGLEVKGLKASNCLFFKWADTAFLFYDVRVGLKDIIGKHK